MNAVICFFSLFAARTFGKESSLKRKMNHNRSAAEMAGLTVLNLSGKLTLINTDTKRIRKNSSFT
jgi:hypothetical protein